MRKFLSFLLILTVLIVFPAKANAAGTVYELPELGLSVSFPWEFDVLTRYTSADDPLMAEYGMDGNQVLSYFRDNNIYCNAISTVRNEEIVVTMMESPLMNMRDMGEAFVLSLANSLEQEYTAYGMTITDYEIYHHDQEMFLLIHFQDLQGTVHGVQYYTIHNGQAINFTLRSYEGTPTAVQEAAIADIVSGVVFLGTVEETEPFERTEAFTHTDPDTGAVFTVPENWKVEELSKERETIDAKFVSTQDPGLAIMYGSTDLWEQLSSVEKFGKQRSDFDTSVFTAADVADMMEVDESAIERVLINGEIYYCAEIQAAEYGLTVTLNQAFRIENGWIYLYQFGASRESSHYDDFLSLLKSAQYPEPEKPDNSGVIVIVITACMLLCVAVAALVILIKGKKKNAAVARRAPETNRQTASRCHACGAKLPETGRFCQNCGAKIEEWDW